MKRLKLALELFFQRQTSEDEDASLAFDRMAREIKGSILALVTLFILFSLVSYIPLDSFNIFQGRLDHMNNLGGIVGAIVGEWFLGTVGFPGYTSVLIMAWLSFTTFRGVPLKDNVFKILGASLGACLAAIAFHLFMGDKTPDLSLFQGGMVGKTAGEFLRQYFNTAGAVLIVTFGFLVTGILTTGLSITRLTSKLFEGKGEEGAENEEDEDTVPMFKVKPKPVIKKSKPATIDSESDDSEQDYTEAAPQKRKPRAKKAKTDDSVDETANAEDEKTDELDLNADEDGDGGIKTYEFEELKSFMGPYELPTTRLLKGESNGAKKMSKGEVKENSQKLCEHLLSFQITGEVTEVSQGPVLTTYEFKPSAGIKLSKIAALQDDLGVVLGTNELRIVAPIPGKTVVGIEVPRVQSETIPFKELVSDDAFYDKKYKIPIALGKSTDGKPVYGDLVTMPHLLVAGATGSGKSVFINTLIMSFLYRLTPQQLRLILVDPKMLELSIFDGIPHLITNVITNNNIAFNALNWAVDEMERRYALMAKTGSKNIESYNSKQKSASEKLPFIVVVVDELADLMMSGGEMVEVAITRLAQKARAAGIHLVIATQRPSTDVITGLIKANIPSRLSFKVPSAIDSRTVLDSSGAESLVGRGDSLMMQPASPIRRIHGCFVTEDELARVVKNVKGGKNHQSNYIQFPAYVDSSG